MSELSQNDKLRALGLKGNSTQQNSLLYLYEEVRDHYGEGNYDTFKSDVQALSDFAAFETYLQDTVGMSADDAQLLRQDLEARFTDWSSFSSSLDQFTTFNGWVNSFNSGVSFTGPTVGEDGRSNAGIRVHGSEGVSFSGVQVPAGTVEIFGPRVEFSQGGQTTTTPGVQVSTTNLQVSDTTPWLGFPITITADLENTGSYEAKIVAVLTEDHERIDSEVVSIPSGSTETVEFTRTYSEFTSTDIRVNDAGPISITVTTPLVGQ